MITKFNFMPSDETWRRVKNHCRTTDNKDFTGNNATDTFKKKILFSEHSPIRLLEFDWSWKGIKYWVHAEWARHKFEKFISTQRNDRQKNYDRNKAPQDAPVNFDGFANMQNLIDAWRKRLCFQVCALLHMPMRNIIGYFLLSFKIHCIIDKSNRRNRK